VRASRGNLTPGWSDRAGRVFGEPRREVDDRDQAASSGAAQPRRSTRLLDYLDRRSEDVRGFTGSARLNAPFDCGSSALSSARERRGCRWHGRQGVLMGAATQRTVHRGWRSIEQPPLSVGRRLANRVFAPRQARDKLISAVQRQLRRGHRAVI
jgi:hypothetical protein